MSQKVKYILDEELIPTHWYNIESDLPVHTPPPVDPSTGEYLEIEAPLPQYFVELLDKLMYNS